MNNEAEGISIIVPIWNGEKWLTKCFESIFSQSYKNFEIIAINNASSDATAKLLDLYVPSIKIIKSEKNLGYSSAINLGMQVSAFSHCLILNIDTWLPVEFLECCFREYRLRNLDVIGFKEYDYQTLSPSHDHSKVISIDIFGYPVLSADPKKQFYLSGVCLFFSRSVYEGSGGLDNKFFLYFEEVDWFWRLHLYGYKIGCSEGGYVYHSGHSSNNRAEVLNEKRFRLRNENCTMMLLKNHSFLMLMLILPFYTFFYFLESLVFLVVLRRDLFLSYYRAFFSLTRKLPEILKDRKLIRKKKTQSDFFVLKKMYLGNAKLIHLFSILKPQFKTIFFR